jgi:hypothetical protein
MGIVERRTPVFEPLAAIAVVSLVTSWIIQPYLAHALAQQGPVAQQAAQGALWLSGVLSPFAAFGKALAAALVCWACSVFLGERLPFMKLISVFCVAELVFSLRDLTVAGVLAARGVGAVHTATDLMVAFGVNAFVHAISPLQRISVESWDFFTVAWASLVCALLRGACKGSARSAIVLAAVAFTVRTLFAAAALLYTL